MARAREALGQLTKVAFGQPSINPLFTMFAELSGDAGIGRPIPSRAPGATSGPLTAARGNRVAARGNVRTMKSGIPWSIKGIDEEARQAALEAARQAGLSLNEWLNQAIARHAAEEGVDPQFFAREGRESDNELRNLASSIAELTRRIRAMDVSSRAATSGLKDRLDEIEEKLGRADQGSGDDERRMQSLKGVSVLVDKLARELDNADETARSHGRGAAPAGGGNSRTERLGGSCRRRNPRARAAPRRHRRQDQAACRRRRPRPPSSTISERASTRCWRAPNRARRLPTRRPHRSIRR